LEYRELGKSGIKISAVGLGTWQWGSREWGWNRLYRKSDVLAAFQKALEVGINFIDTAEIYGGGKSEKILGEAIHDHREDVVIATKVWAWNVSPGRLLRAAERSLRRLGVDVIDLYQIHWPNPIVPLRGTMKAMRKLVQDGKVRAVGVSNFNLDRLKNAQKALAPLELASNQVRYNLLNRKIEQKLLPYTKAEKITVIAYSPLAQGLLTNKYTQTSRPSSLVQTMNPGFSSRNLARLAEVNRTLSEIAKTHGKTPSQVALNWLIRNENVVAIPGVKKPEHAIDDAGALGWTLSTSEVEKLEKSAAVIQFSKLGALQNLLGALTRYGKAT
jgi:myo-inositol catabolism protein IolS